MFPRSFVQDILSLTFDVDDMPDEFRAQLLLFDVTRVVHTGMGVYLYVSARAPIKAMPVGHPNAWEGPEIKFPELDVHAACVVQLRDGRIDHIEMWSASGDFPQGPIGAYRLQQTWQGSSGEWIESNDKGRSSSRPTS